MCRHVQKKCTGPEERPTFCASLCNQHARPLFHRRRFMQTCTGRIPGPRSWTQTLCEPEQPTSSACHKSSFFVPNLLEKRRATRPGCTPCATCPRTMLEIYNKNATPRSLRVSLHNRHACQHFTRCIYAEIYTSNAADHGEQL